MANLTFFEIFFIVHLIMDFIFQRHRKAPNKYMELRDLIVHCSIYTIGFIPVFWFLNVNLLWLVVIFASHFIIDQNSIILWILEKFKGIKKEKTSESLWILLLIGVDQMLHASVLVLIIIFQ